MRPRGVVARFGTGAPSSLCSVGGPPGDRANFQGRSALAIRRVENRHRVLRRSTLVLLARSGCGAIKTTAFTERQGIKMRCSGWILGGMLAASLNAGCALLVGIEDFPDSVGTESTGSGTSGGGTAGANCLNLNGCKAEMAEDRTNETTVPVSIGASPVTICVRVASKTTVEFKTDGTPCLLRGGIDGSVQMENPIEMLVDGGANIDFSTIAPIETNLTCIPFFCEQEPSGRRGVIFVE